MSNHPNVPAASAMADEIADREVYGTNLLNFDHLKAMLTEAYEEGRKAERKALSAATRDRDALRDRLVARLDAGGFGTYAYEKVPVRDVAEDMLDELGL